MRKAVRLGFGFATLFVAIEGQADDGGISFWLPGQFGALAAAPTEPGWSLPLIYYHVSAKEDGNKGLARGGRTTFGLDAKADILFAFPTYTFAEPVLGAQLALAAGAAVARSEASVDVTLTGPRGRTFSGGTDDALKGGSDILTTRIDWSISVWAMRRWMPAVATPISTKRTNSPRSRA
jgi:hypothetical protein